MTNRLITIQKLGPMCDVWAKEIDDYYGPLLRKRQSFGYQLDTDDPRRDFAFKLDTTPFDTGRRVSCVVSYYSDTPEPAPHGWGISRHFWNNHGYFVVVLAKNLEGII